MLKIIIPAVAVLAVVWFIEIPKEWLPGKNARQLQAEKDKADADKAEAARRAVEAVAVKRYDDPEGFFTINFPGKPVRHGIHSNAPFASLLTVAGYSHTGTIDGIHYDARYERWHSVANDTRGKLDRMKPKLIRSPDFPAPRYTELRSANGVVGFEAKGIYEERPRKYKMTRVFLVPEQEGTDRYYSATVTGPADWLPNPAAEAFLESFELTDKVLAFPLPGAPGAVIK